MKLLVAVAMFVLVPIVFADDVMWESVPNWSLPPDVFVYEGVPVSKRDIAPSADNNAKPYKADYGPQSPLSFVNPQPGAHPLQTTKSDNNEREEEKELVDRIANDIQRDLVVVTVFTGVFQLVILAVQVWLARAATLYAGEAAKAATESSRIARVALEVAERADLIVEQCSFEGEYDKNPLKITLPLTNAGRTRATIVASIVQGFVGDRPPTPLVDDKLLQRTLEGFIVPSQRTCNQHCTLNMQPALHSGPG